MDADYHGFYSIFQLWEDTILCNLIQFSQKYPYNQHLTTPSLHNNFFFFHNPLTTLPVTLSTSYFYHDPVQFSSGRLSVKVWSEV